MITEDLRTLPFEGEEEEFKCDSNTFPVHIFSCT